MRRFCLFLLLPLSILGITHASNGDPAPRPKLRLAELQKRAADFNTVLSLPTFETTPEQIAANTDSAIDQANRQLDTIGKLGPNEVTFANTVRALDDMGFEVAVVADRLSVLKEAHPDPKLRSAAIDALQKLDDWTVGVDYRKDVYRAVKAFANTKPNLSSEEDRRLLEETLRDYRRAGLELSETQQQQVEAQRKELARLEQIFQININNATTPVRFTKAELEGVPEATLAKFKTGDDQYTFDANVTFQAQQIYENAVQEETRKKFYLARENRARDKNIALLRRALELRSALAHELGYASWADYRTETRMAKTGVRASAFLEKLKIGLEPKYQAELAQFKQIKAKVPGSSTPEVNLWDWSFCAEQLRREKFHINSEDLRVYFPFDKVLQGMFAVYERIFDIRISEVEPPSKYVDDLRLFAVLDANNGQPLGMLYMDMFPRPGKYNHFANFSLIDGKLLPDGRYQRPTTSLICNFPTPSKDAPSLMSHEDVTTIFHEFGHAMHAILTQAHYARFSGTNVPRDFVEAPSQMLEYFTWDKRVLDSFAADYRDSNKKIPQEILTELKAADLATKGCEYRRQLSFGLLDLALNSNLSGENLDHLNEFSNKVLADTFLPPDPGTALIAGFGHEMGYDAGYYGYAWADAIAADMASVFEAAPDGFLDEKVGRRLRDEIYAQGNARDIGLSVEKFLGRSESIEPFLEKKLGLTKESFR
jgi:thimet oligopeptidase